MRIFTISPRNLAGGIRFPAPPSDHTPPVGPRNFRPVKPFLGPGLDHRWQLRPDRCFLPVMPDLNALFLKVGNYCRRELITCSPAERLTDAAAIM